MFGDSLAAGVGASSFANSFIGIMYGRLAAGDASSTIADLAASGASTADVLNSQLPAADRLNADATDVWLCVGGNDVFHQTSADAFSQAEHAVVELVRARWPKAHIIVFGVPDVAVVPLLPGNSQLHDLATADDAAAEDAARTSQADFVDLFAFTDSESIAGRLSQDALHPNDAGHAAIAAFASKRLR